MLRNLLVPLDGSPLAERAVGWAECLASATGARVSLLRAERAGKSGPAVNAPDASAYLEGVSARLREAGVTIGHVEVAAAEPAEAIASAAETWRADLVIMATHGRSGVGRMVYGSVAEGVIQRGGAPVLLVRAGHPDRLPSDAGARILASLDGSSFAEAALPLAIELATALKGELILLRAVEIGSPPLALEGFDPAAIQDPEALREEALVYLRDVAARLHREEPNATVRLDVRIGDPAAAIVDATAEHHSALDVIATHGRTGVGRMLLGSVADAVLRHGTVPVVVVHQQGPAAAMHPLRVEAVAPAPGAA